MEAVEWAIESAVEGLLSSPRSSRRDRQGVAPGEEVAMRLLGGDSPGELIWSIWAEPDDSILLSLVPEEPPIALKNASVSAERSSCGVFWGEQEVGGEQGSRSECCWPDVPLAQQAAAR